MSEIYLEYKIKKNRLGLMGDVTSLFGMLGLNIKRVGSIPPDRRAFILEVPSAKYLLPLKSTLSRTDMLEIIAMHSPTYLDYLTLRHGRKISQQGHPPTYHFHRGELPLLIDFIGESLEQIKNPRIGIKGSPRIGKTEVAIAACVHANRRWVLFSSTFLRQIAREKINLERLEEKSVIIIDALTSFFRSGYQHQLLLKQILQTKQPLIIEHPQVLLKEMGQEHTFFDLLIHLKGQWSSRIENDEIDPQPFSNFDLS